MSGFVEFKFAGRTNLSAALRLLRFITQLGYNVQIKISKAHTRQGHVEVIAG